MNYGNKQLKEKIEYYTGDTARRKHRSIVYLTMAAVIFFIGFALCMMAFGLGAFLQILDNAPSIANIDSIKPNENKSIVYAADGSVMQELIQSGSNRVSVDYDQIPEDLVDAFVAIEDSRFFTHDGVDVKGIIRALVVGITSGNLSEGASTITQQLIKNNVFDGGMEKNFGDRIERKFQEQYLALKAEKELNKETIIQYYLNTINLGSNCLGVQVASRRYFGKDVSELDLAECSILAAITNNPTRYNPITHPENNQTRRLKVLRNMLEQGYISQDEFDEAASEDVYKRIQLVSEEYSASNSSHAFSYFTDYVFEDVAEALETQLGYTDTQAYNALYSGGLRIYTTMDPTIQSILDEEVNDPENYIVTDAEGNTTNYLEYALDYQLTIELTNGRQYYYDETNVKNYYQDQLGQTKFKLTFTSEEELTEAADKFRTYILNRTGGKVVSETIISTIEPQVSVVVMDQSTGQVKAVCGGRGNKDEIGSLVLNRATGSTRQPGSTFKVISTYAPALDTDGDTLASTYYDSPVIYSDKTISNWWGSAYLGYTNIRFAIQASSNIVAVKCLENTVTENTAYEYVRNFGITTVIPEDKSPVFTLGGLTYGTTNLEMTAAYASIANDGVYTTPVFWTLITDADGNIILENKAETTTILKTSTAKLLTSALESSVSPQFVLWPDYGITATNVVCALSNMPAAGKSGTTSDANDLWFIGYTPYYTAGIWSGYDSSKSFGESPGYHKVIWQKIMERTHDGLERVEFDYSGLERAEICSKSGLLARSGICDASGDSSCHVYTEYFAKGTAPTSYCDRHTVYQICTASNMLASSTCPLEQVIQVVRITIAPEDDDGYETADTLFTIPEDLNISYCTVHGSGVPPVNASTAAPDPEETEPASSASRETDEPEGSTESTSKESSSETESQTESSTEASSSSEVPETASSESQSVTETQPSTETQAPTETLPPEPVTSAEETVFTEPVETQASTEPVETIPPETQPVETEPVETMSSAEEN